jgi:tyrosinase
MTANLGPISPTLLIPELTAITDFSKMFEGTPRCLRRDVSAWVSSGWSKDSDSASLINNNTDIGSFQDTMQGDFVKGDYGVHAAGHFTIGGDPGGVSIVFVRNKMDDH